MQRKRHTPDLKAKVTLEALRGTKTINEIASEMGIHGTQITQRDWRLFPILQSRSVTSVPGLSNSGNGSQQRESLLSK